VGDLAEPDFAQAVTAERMRVRSVEGKPRVAEARLPVDDAGGGPGVVGEALELGENPLVVQPVEQMAGRVQGGAPPRRRLRGLGPAAVAILDDGFLDDGFLDDGFLDDGFLDDGFLGRLGADDARCDGQARGYGKSGTRSKRLEDGSPLGLRGASASQAVIN
jgi:hypothetical protein